MWGPQSETPPRVNQKVSKAPSRCNPSAVQRVAQQGSISIVRQSQAVGETLRSLRDRRKEELTIIQGCLGSDGRILGSMQVLSIRQWSRDGDLVGMEGDGEGIHEAEKSQTYSGF